MTTEIIGKPCTGCGLFRLFEEYTKHSRGKHGYRSACKACTNAVNTAWRQKNPEASLAASKAWRQANAERVNAEKSAELLDPERQAALRLARERRAAETLAGRTARRKARLAERDSNEIARQAEYAAAYRKANHAKLRAADRERYLRDRVERAVRRSLNPEKNRAYNKAYKAANPERHRIYEQNKRVSRRRAEGRLSPGLVQRLYRLQKGKCPCCRQPLGDDYHLDHRMPLALGGTNTDDNMQLMRATCNMQKHAKHPVEFMQSKGFLL